MTTDKTQEALDALRKTNPTGQATGAQLRRYLSSEHVDEEFKVAAADNLVKSAELLGPITRKAEKQQETIKDLVTALIAVDNEWTRQGLPVGPALLRVRDQVRAAIRRAQEAR